MIQLLKINMPLSIAFWMILTVTASGVAAEDQIDFSRDVLPILSGRCFTCHGPDEGSREGGFRLDDPESVLSEADSGLIPIVPGDPNQSELLRRIVSDDDGERMPPEGIGQPLDATEQKLIADWILSGAKYQRHWSLEPVVRSSLPAVIMDAVPATPIDRFVDVRVGSMNLQESQRPSKQRRIRRQSCADG